MNETLYPRSLEGFENAGVLQNSRRVKVQQIGDYLNEKETLIIWLSRATTFSKHI